MKVHFIIQGPLKTYGQGPNNSANGFKCQSTIMENIRKIEACGFSHLITTWASLDEEHRLIAKKLTLSGANIIEIEPPKRPDPDHRYKHHYGISKALELAPEDQDIYVVKVRTDMAMPIEFFSYITQLRDAPQDKLLVSELLGPFYLGDFVYGGKRGIMKEFLECQLSKPQHPCIACDIGMKYFNYRRDSNLTLLDYIRKPRATAERFQDFVKDHIQVIPKDIYLNILWRGREMNTIFNLSPFSFDSTQINPPPESRIEIALSLIDDYARLARKSNKYSPLAFLYKYSKKTLRIAKKATRLIQNNTQ